MSPRPVKLSELAGLIDSDGLVYVAGASGAPMAFVSELLREPDLTRDTRVLTTYVPGINSLDLSRFHPSAQVTGLFMQPGFSTAQRDGRFRALPMSYSGFVRNLRDQVDIDLAVLQVAAPDAHGQCSLGPAVEFMPIALTKTRRRLGLINSRTPALRGSVGVPYNQFDYICEVDSDLPEYITSVDPDTETVARHIASFIEDGSVLQLGLGKVPTALAASLRSRRKLRLHSGMLSDGFLDLADVGALDMDYQHTACVLVGSRGFYIRAGKFEPLRIRGCEFTHDLVTLASMQRLVAVNSALEVDLFGQCNLEHANGSAVSGVGGAADFARAARLSPGGRSIVALNARHRSGSRIVPTLGSPGVTSLSRIDVDFVVTEFGVAQLAGASVHERAQSLIEVAAPEHRSVLRDRWRDVARTL
ncbi:MAG TPA: acetyl-CoA hydrolase/transferase C-terminal domain-containing protein [Steroidobacteraceae bacterium]